MKRLHMLAVVVMLAIVTTTVVLAQSDPDIAIPEVCSERHSVFQDGVLIYECEIMERAGSYVIVERSRDNVVSERAATQLEISTHISTIAERDCVTRRQNARRDLSTPIPRADVDTLAARVALLEAAILDCVP